MAFMENSLDFIDFDPIFIVQKSYKISDFFEEILDKIENDFRHCTFFCSSANITDRMHKRL